MKTIEFIGYTCNVNISEYADNGRIAITLTDAEDNSPIGVASVNIPEFAGLAENDVFIKNWSENEGILEALVDAGIVRNTGMTFPCGFVEANLCTLVTE